MDVRDALSKFCQLLAPGSVLLVDHVPDPEAQLQECFDNCTRKVIAAGGAVQYGWAFCVYERLLQAFHHAVWRSPEGVLIDITPLNISPLMDGQRLPFLPDDNAILTPSPKGTGIACPCRAFPLSKNAEVKKAARRFNQAERERYNRLLGKV